VTADTCRVVHRALVFASVVCCTLVAASFVFFARDQIAGASKHQQNELVAGAPAGSGQAAKQHVVAQPRRFIDGATKTLTSPFSTLVHSSNDWVRTGLPDAIALLTYGLGISFLARFVRRV
jgi:hypothetical protein